MRRMGMGWSNAYEDALLRLTFEDDREVVREGSEFFEPTLENA